MASVESTIAELGFELPVAPKPVASYVPAVKAGKLVYTSGQLPMRNGQLMATGIVGKDVTEQEAAACALQCAINCLAAAKTVIASLDSVVRVVKLTVFVASTPEFTGQPQVGNGASDFLLKVFGERGQHARSAVGAPSLPRNTPVEIEMILEVSE